MKSIIKYLLPIPFIFYLANPVFEKNMHYSQNEKTALFIIDMQKRFISRLDTEEIKKEIPKQIEMIRYSIKNNIPIYLIEFGENSNTIPEIKNELKDVKYKTIIKNEESAFTESSLEKSLEKDKIKNIILMGIYASACVKSTGKDAVNHNYNILTSNELIANPKGTKRFFESSFWYKRHGTIFSRAKDLENFLIISNFDHESF